MAFANVPGMPARAIDYVDLLMDQNSPSIAYWGNRNRGNSAAYAVGGDS
ncbi:MAG: hypothetical protein R3C05_12370 [Pirellulaceae bacterium]